MNLLFTVLNTFHDVILLPVRLLWSGKPITIKIHVNTYLINGNSKTCKKKKLTIEEYLHVWEKYYLTPGEKKAI